MERMEGKEATSAINVDMNRRGFLKGAALSALGIAGMGALAGCGQAKSANSASTDDSSKAAEEFKADETRDADIVVIGAGAAGMMAAHVAAQGGAKVVILEKGADYSAPNGMYVS
ncbi:MAG: NAD(P)/FAD-dependent oxidoreductase, partial [Eggerthellaceae bacterium]|nr:NAD(P)/FAD-dependent oxidoreductase [Eggerthellaceae bacterium]